MGRKAEMRNTRETNVWINNFAQGRMPPYPETASQKRSPQVRLRLRLRLRGTTVTDAILTSPLQPEGARCDLTMEHHDPGDRCGMFEIRLGASKENHKIVLVPARRV